MGRLLILLAMMAGCAGDDPHELGTCGDRWDPAIAKCEAACEQPPTMAGPACQTGPSGDRCSATFEFDGQRGCCAPVVTPDGPHAVFSECVD